MRTADVQADLSLRYAYMPFCWLCHDDNYRKKSGKFGTRTVAVIILKMNHVVLQ